MAQTVMKLETVFTGDGRSVNLFTTALNENNVTINRETDATVIIRY